MSSHDRVRFAQEVRSGKASATTHAKETLERVRAANARLNAYNEVLEESCLADAAEADRRRSGALAGMMLAVKDNIATKVGHTTCSSKMLKNYRSPYEATVITKLRDAGAVIVGKTNLDEFAMGSSTENSAFGMSKNPWDLSRVPGGSSGGSAAAMAAGLCDIALGSDTGGSIRQPASLCGIVGLKPTYGRVSRYGLVAFGSSLDQIGPITRTVRDAAAVLQVIAGHDPRDSTSADMPVEDYVGELDEPLRGLRVGVPKEYLSDANDPRVNTAVREASEVYRKLGARIVEGIELPLTDVGISTYYVIAPAEASSNLARYDGIRYGHRAQLAAGEDLFDLYAKSRAEGFGPEVQRRIMIGTYVLSSGYYDAYYKRALQVRRLIKQEFDRAFERCDILLGPTSPTPAFVAGGKSDPLSMYLCDVYTVNTNIAGIPGISIQGGMADEGGKKLPIGIQLQAKPFAESMLLRAARMFESATTWHTMAPTA
jgi:aspartyl-tRNA(Asn)/glutamyl-tRNA(Gln) amidotransferase subunit A